MNDPIFQTRSITDGFVRVFGGMMLGSLAGIVVLVIGMLLLHHFGSGLIGRDPGLLAENGYSVWVAMLVGGWLVLLPSILFATVSAARRQSRQALVLLITGGMVLLVLCGAYLLLPGSKLVSLAGVLAMLVLVIEMMRASFRMLMPFAWRSVRSVRSVKTGPELAR